ncbi:uncharacterized protein PGRI_085070 [Penicillium griseofulvum]|uniref:Uncharacterized protein n=1 Tax=Penicillium patulum TaxID=5078 RepID=A0A135LTC1_PENPA|nr:uncharacterized protein PGRI_085070 [Penicillium griseofulvum]KXG52223.1 hypothetical protein PGRI_085070 [Penicillium griseofulvum]
MYLYHVSLLLPASSYNSPIHPKSGKLTTKVFLTRQLLKYTTSLRLRQIGELSLASEDISTSHNEVPFDYDLYFQSSLLLFLFLLYLSFFQLVYNPGLFQNLILLRLCLVLILETAEMEILAGITQLAVMLDRKDGLDEAHQEERDRLASGIEDAKVLLGLHLCRIENDVTRQVLLDTFLRHLGPTDAPWMLGPLLARIASGI